MRPLKQVKFLNFATGIIFMMPGLQRGFLTPFFSMFFWVASDCQWVVAVCESQICRINLVNCWLPSKSRRRSISWWRFFQFPVETCKLSSKNSMMLTLFDFHLDFFAVHPTSSEWGGLLDAIGIMLSLRRWSSCEEDGPMLCLCRCRKTAGLFRTNMSRASLWYLP